MTRVRFTTSIVLFATLWQCGTADLLGDISSTVTKVVVPDTCCPDLGCFSNGAPWTTLERPVPPPDCNFNVTFWLCRNGSDPILLTTKPNVNFDGTPFNASRKTILICHGFTQNVISMWPQYMAEIIQAKTGHNVIAVDWKDGAKGPNYLQATSNTRITGAHIGRILQYLIDRLKISRKDIYLIGHSLGAQIMSYAANRINGVGRITGLDPAQPLFEGLDKSLRLDRNDACFVDVMHTSARPFIPTFGLGVMEPCGDIDFYPNGGAYQPGCSDVSASITQQTFDPLDALSSAKIVAAALSCSHLRAYMLFNEAFLYNNCTMWGHVISSFDEHLSYLQNGDSAASRVSSDTCEANSCSPIGSTTTMYGAEGPCTLKTNAASPYCIADPEDDASMASARLDDSARLLQMCALKNIKI